MPIIINDLFAPITYPPASLPVFAGPNFSPLSILTTDSGSKNVGTLFTAPVGTTLTFLNQGAAPVGVTFTAATGLYSWSGAVTQGNYSMITRAAVVGSPTRFTDFAWTLQVNSPGGNPPVFTGPIADQSHTGITGTFTFDTSTYATGQTSYTKTGAVTGITFNTTTGVFTVNAGTLGVGTFGPFTVNYINSFGTTASNQFHFTIVAPTTKRDPVGYWARLAGKQDPTTTQQFLTHAHSTAVKPANGGPAAPTPASPYVWSNPIVPSDYDNNLITGMVFDYTWKILEPTQGSYPLFKLTGQVTTDLKWCAARGLYFILLIDDRNFNSEDPNGPPGNTLIRPLPAWMDTLNPLPPSNINAYPLQVSFLVRAGVNTGKFGFSALRYKPEYIASMKLLIDAIVAAYDDVNDVNRPENAFFQGISFQESAIGSGVSPGTNPINYPDVHYAGTTGYSPTLYRNALINYLSYANTSMTNGRVYWMQNFIAGTGGQAMISDVMVGVGKDIRIGGPDLKPDEGSLTGGGHPAPKVGTGIASNFDAASTDNGPPHWNTTDAPYNNYHNDQTLPAASRPPIGALDFGAGTFCTVASGDDIGLPGAPMAGPYKAHSIAKGGYGPGNGPGGAIDGTEGPSGGPDGWVTGDNIQWGIRNLKLDSVWLYDGAVGNDNAGAKAIWFQRVPFNKNS